MMRRLLVLAALCSTFIVAWNAQASDFVKGRVFNSEREAIVGARVFTLPATQVTCTDAQGEYRLGGYPAEWKTEVLTVFVHLPDGRLLSAPVILDGDGRHVDFLSESNLGYEVSWSGCQASRQILPKHPMWVTGSVIGEDSKPIAGAVVRRPGFRGIRTDKYGHYTMHPSALGRAGNIKLKITRSGYQPATSDVITAPGEIRWFEALLVKIHLNRPSQKRRVVEPQKPKAQKPKKQATPAPHAG